MEFNLLEKKADEMLQKREEEKKLKILIHQEKLKKKGINNLYYNAMSNSSQSNEKDIDNDSNSKKLNRSDLFNKSNS